MNKSEPAGADSPDVGHGSMQGKTILVTRARAQSQEITARLEALGANVIHCATIEVVPPTSWKPLDEAISKLESYDWLVFTSANGVHFFFRRLSEIRSDVARAIAERLVCAIGPATASAIEASGAVVHVTASDSKAEGALTAIIDNVGGAENIRGLRFLMPRARVARDILPAALRSLGAHVDAVEAYQTVKPNVDRESVLRLFTDNSIDVITFTSSSTVSNFAEIVGLTDLSDLLSTTLVACIGPVTAKTAAEHGLRRIIQPKLYNAAELVDCIAASIGRG